MLTNLDIVAVIIAISGLMLVSFLFWKQNIELQKQNRHLRSRIKHHLTK